VFSLIKNLLLLEFLSGVAHARVSVDRVVTKDSLEKLLFHQEVQALLLFASIFQKKMVVLDASVATLPMISATTVEMRS
jgi:hypothetical protein